MPWQYIKDQLLDAAKSIRNRKVLDATVEGLLGQIPFVGQFARSYWAALDLDDETKAENVAVFLEEAAKQEERYLALTNQIDNQSEVLLEKLLRTDSSIQDVLSEISVVGINLDEIRERVKKIELNTEKIVKAGKFALIGICAATTVAGGAWLVNKMLKKRHKH